MRFNHSGVIGEIDNLPGCSQVAVLHSVFTRCRGIGLGKAAHKERLADVDILGYDATICTADSTNQPQLKILEANGWNKLAEFRSTKTGHLVGIWYKHIDHGD